MTIDPRGPGPLFAVSLASVTLIGPLAVHLFLPAKAALGLSDAVAQRTLSISLCCSLGNSNIQ